MTSKSILILFLFSSIFGLSQHRIEKTNPLKLVLEEISQKAIELGQMNPYFTQKQLDSMWIGYDPATKLAIEQKEKQMGIKFPIEYVNFLLLTNRFQSAIGVDPSFCTIDKIDFLKNLDPELIEIWSVGNQKVGDKLKTAIKVGGFDEEQFFFLIPPSKDNPNWEYWSFAAWAPGEAVHKSLYEYFLNVLETINYIMEKENHQLISK